MRTKLLALLLLALPLGAFAQNASVQNTPVGHWTTIDDKTDKPKSVVEIYEAKDGSLAGRVVEVLQSDRGPNPVCDKCSGDRKNKPVKGMVILWGIRKEGESWEGGKILDPSSGKIYSVRVTPMDGGKALEVRGYMGFSMLGRNQTWLRR
ncbi:DUF2147 domain-containing protein [Lysobacter soli]|uniref:DUF2147 domain-containing protein n=1 Tax=Lysobacter soli TaxID=453783 RepID=UPI0012ED6810|nr:DUF2147 domain-containing protein [Lysobacter soli]QGW64667.1 DUF2147 domain-containing protein [Lysobacter soli]